MIINRAYIREVAQSGAAVTIMIAGIFVVVRLVRFLSKAAAGEIPVDSIFLLLALKVVTFIDLILPLTLYAAILIVINRWIRDNEYTVLQACGFGLYQLLKPTLALVLAVGAVVSAFSFYLTPRAMSYSNRIMEEAKNQTSISGVVPGVFSDRQGHGVYYVENISPDGKTLENVFVYGKTPTKEDVVVAKDGYQYVDQQTGDRFLVLRNGTRYEGVPGQADYTVLNFQTYALRVKTKVEFKATTSVKSMPTAQLLHTKGSRAVAEWQWRLSKPLSVPILALLALSFTYLTVRKGQFLRMVMAFGMYFLYANLLGYAHALVQRGKISPELGLWWVHVVFIIVATYLFIQRARNRPVFALPGRPRGKA